MSWEHVTLGFTRFDTVVDLLDTLEVPYSMCGVEELAELELWEQTPSHDRLRKLAFEGPGGKMVAEEYLAVSDRECDGTSVVAVAIYPYRWGRPDLKTEVFCGDAPDLSI